MNAAEEIVKIWLEQRGYFHIDNLAAGGRKEIDFLAVKPGSGGRIGEKCHVEVSVSTRPNLSWSKKKHGSIERIADRDVKTKFHDRRVIKEAEKRFGRGPYKKIFVKGPLDRNGTERERWIRQVKRKGVEVKKFEEIVSEVRDSLKDVKLHPTNSGQVLQFLTNLNVS